MLVVNRYENRQTGKVTIQAHVLKGKKLIKSYAPCCPSLINMIAQHYSFYLLCDVDYYSKLKTVNIVNAWKWGAFMLSSIYYDLGFKAFINYNKIDVLRLTFDFIDLLSDLM